MKKIITAKLAGTILIVVMTLFAILHLLVLLKFIPSDIVWGGQIKNGSVSMITMETIALIVTVFFMLIIAAKAGFIKTGKFGKFIHISVWIIFVYFILNTIGNIASGVSVEKWIFAPVTVILTLCAFRLAIEK
jgi:hypothetical protein